MVEYRVPKGVRNRISFLGDGNLQVPTLRTSAYFEAEHALQEYKEAVTLFGIRRTGKTTIMLQLWEKYHTEQSIFLTIDREVAVWDLREFLAEEFEKVDLLFIDEVTRLQDIDTEFHVLLDYFKNKGTKVILAGTDSYLLSLAGQDTALGRLTLIRTVPLLFEDLKKVNGYGFQEFCLTGKMFTEDSQEQILADNIFHSIDRSFSSKHLLQGMSIEHLKQAIELLVELLIGQVDSRRLPTLKIKLNNSKYEIEDERIYHLQGVNADEVNEVFNILRILDVVKVVPRYRIAEADTGVELKFDRDMFYVSLPALYWSVLLKLTEGDMIKIKSSYLGVLFEAAAITQIEQKLQVVGLAAPTCFKFSLSDSGECGYEVDYCVSCDDVLSLIEFKVNSGKNAKHFRHPLVERLSAGFADVRRYVVYLRGEPREREDVQYVSVEDFLSNLERYVQ